MTPIIEAEAAEVGDIKLPASVQPFTSLSTAVHDQLDRNTRMLTGASHAIWEGVDAVRAAGSAAEESCGRSGC